MKSNNVSKGKMIASIVGISVATILIIIAFCGRYVDGGFKKFGNFFLGSFGMAFYGIMAAVIVACSFTLAGKSLKIPLKYAVFFALTFVTLVLLVHMWTTTYLPGEFHNDTQTGYVQLVYNYYNSPMGVPTFGGVVFGSIAYGLTAVLTIWGASIVVLALLALSVYFVGDFFYAYYTHKLTLHSKPEKADIEPSEETTSTPDTVANKPEDSRQRAYEILFEGQTYPEEVSTTTTEQRFETSPQSQLDSTPNGHTSVEDFLFGPGNATAQPKPTTGGNGFFRSSKNNPSNTEDEEFIVRGYYNPSESVEKKNEKDTSSSWIVSTPVDSVKEPPKSPVVNSTPTYKVTTPIIEQPQETIESKVVDIVDLTVEEEKPQHQDVPFVVEPLVPVAQQEETVVEEEEIPVVEEHIVAEESLDKDEVVAIPAETIIKTPVGDAVQEKLEFYTRGELEEKQQATHKFSEYNHPPFELLDDVTIVDDDQTEDQVRIAEAIISKFQVFGIELEIADIVAGPAVTRYMFNVLSKKTRMNEFAKYSDDIKGCVEAREGIIIQAPVHGTNLVGIDVPNKKRRPVVLRSILESDTFKNHKGNLVFALGQEITGRMIVADLSETPHLLIAGATGSGKSVALNCMIVSLMYKYGPEYVRFIMVDPKYVELSKYNGIPHMLTSEAIVELNDALAAMDYLIKEMDARYQLLRAKSVSNIVEYNNQINTKIEQKMPYMVFIVDELADLMAVSRQAVEAKLQRLAAMARAAGIHIVLATQRPDVKTITGTIKANLPSRMAFKVVTQFDSNTILGYGGAEKLLGKGDMLYMSSGSPVLERVQGALVTTDEIRDLVKFAKESNEVYYDDKVSEEIFVSRKQAEEANQEQEADKEGGAKELDPACKKALRFWLEKKQGKASIASIQRNLNIGFNRAGRIVDSLAQLGYIEELSPSDSGTKPRKVLVTLEQLDELFPDMPDL